MSALLPGERLLRFGSGNVQIVDTDRPEVTLRLDFQDRAARPFLKWTGGKQWLAPLVTAMKPKSFRGRYHEPFLGGGSIFFAGDFSRATLSDLNPELITAYRAVRDEPEAVISLLREYPYDKTFFLGMRALEPKDPVEIAARMIYLNKTAFNGMYRVNRNGVFNVPFGRYVNPTICPSDRIRAASEVLQGTQLHCSDFAVASRRARRGDLVFFDPPYITGHHNNGFRKYNANLFKWDDQIRLAGIARRLAERGVHVIVSNSSHEAVRDLYTEFTTVKVERRSLINSKADGRQLVPEALYMSFDLLLEA